MALVNDTTSLQLRMTSHVDHTFIQDHACMSLFSLIIQGKCAHTAANLLVKTLSVLESSNDRIQNNFSDLKMAQNTYIHD